MQWIMQERVDLARPQGLHRWSEQLMMPGDANAHRWAVTVYRDGVPLDLTGWDVHAYLTRADNVCVPLHGMADGCAAGVSFEAGCYAVRGELRGTLQACKDDARITLAHGIWQVGKPHSDQVVDPGDVIPSLQELLAQISAMEATTADCRAVIAEASDAIDEMEQAMTTAAPPVVCAVSGAVVTIDDAAERVPLQLTSAIVPVQTGSGTPGMSNVRVLSGRTSAVLTRSDGDAQDAVLSADLPEAVYGGVLDWLTGVLTVTHALGEVTAFDTLYTNVGAGLTCGQANKWPGMRQGGGADGWCEMLPPVASIAHQTAPCISFGGTSSRAIYAAYPAEVVGATLEELNAYVASHPLRVVVPLEAPYTLQLTAQQLEMLDGVNVLQSDCGDTSVVYIADTRRYIDKGDKYADVAGLAFEADRAGSADVAAHAATADSAATAAHADDADTVQGVDVIAALAVAAGGIVCDTRGDVVSVADTAERNALSVVSAITPVQSGSGNPSPDNVRPISGWDTAVLMHAGRNLVRYPYQDTTMTHNGITFTDNGDGTITANGTATDRATFYLSSRIQPLHLKKGCTYTISGAPGVTGAFLYLQDTTFKQTVADPLNVSKTITAEYDDYYMFLRVEAGITLDNAVFRPMLVMGDTAQEFEPYQGQTLSADLPETVYGGTLDWMTGLLTVTHKRSQLAGTFTGILTTIPGYVGGVVAVMDMMPESCQRGYCDSLIPVERPYTQYINGASITFGFVGAPKTVYAYIPEASLADSTLEAFNNYFAANPATIVYPLETPYTIQLTPQQLQLLKGSNALWSTTGETSLAYIADTKLYIDNAIAALAANQLNT